MYAVTTPQMLKSGRSVTLMGWNRGLADSIVWLVYVSGKIMKCKMERPHAHFPCMEHVTDAFILSRPTMVSDGQAVRPDRIPPR